MQTVEKISMREKVGFSLGDAAANFIFQTIMLLQLSFYTDTFGLTAVAAGTLFLIGRIYGAIADPIVGAMADRTETKWGKFRPWLLWTAVPFGIISFFAFYTPDLAKTGKIIYAFATYLLLMTVYSANNIPYSALGGVITGDMKERNSLFSVKFIFVVLATLAIQGLALPMVNHFGQTGGEVDSKKGYMITMGIFSALAVIFFIFTFATTRERVKPDPKQKTTLKQDISDLVGNRPWVYMFIVFVMMFIFLSMRNGILIFYFRYYLSTDSIIDLMHGLDKVLFGLLGTVGMISENSQFADNAFSIINIFSQLAALLGLIFSKRLANALGKRDAFKYVVIAAGIIAASFIFIPPTGAWATLFMQLAFNFVWGVSMPLPWAMMADVADYGDWKNNRRATAIVFAGVVLGLKLGLAIGGAISGYILNGYGYVVNAATQSASAVNGIRLLTSIYPAIGLIILVVALLLYKINKSTEIEMQDALVARRNANKG